MQAMASFVYKLYKSKKCVRDIIPKVEGKKSSDWIAVDLGNKIYNFKIVYIKLHLGIAIN